MIQLITFIFNVADYILTANLVNRFGIEIEANPVGVLLLQHPVIKIIGVGIALAVLYLLRRHKLARIFSWVAFASYSFLIIYHIVIQIILWRILS